MVQHGELTGGVSSGLWPEHDACSWPQKPFITALQEQNAAQDSIGTRCQIIPFPDEMVSRWPDATVLLFNVGAVVLLEYKGRGRETTERGVVLVDRSILRASWHIYWTSDTMFLKLRLM